jgi:hypothetical protein
VVFVLFSFLAWILLLPSFPPEIASLEVEVKSIAKDLFFSRGFILFTSGHCRVSTQGLAVVVVAITANIAVSGRD